MDKRDFAIIILFILIVATMIYTWKKINIFMPTLETCEDDFEIIKKCSCVPNSWKNPEQYYEKGLYENGTT